jgi:hypothetical protein
MAPDPPALCRPGGTTPPSPPARPFAEPPGHQAPVTLGIQIGQQDGECLADDPATVHGNAESAERETGALQVQQLAAGQVDGDLLSVQLSAAGLALSFDRGTPAGRTEQLGDPRQAYPP